MNLFTRYIISFAASTFIIVLTGCGGGGSSTENTAPVASAGNDQTVYVGEVVSLDGSGSSDADGNPLTYLWTIISIPQASTLTALADNMTVHPSFTPDQEGAYILQLVVNDGLLDSQTDRVTINAQNCVVDRTYTINTPITYSCAFGIFSINVTSITFSQNGSRSTPLPSFPGDMTGGTTSCPSGSFSHQYFAFGACAENHVLNGSFTGPDTWSGTLTTEFTGAGCFDCVGSNYNIDATAQ